MLVASVAGVLLLAGCGSDEAPRTTASPAAALEGTWKTGPISPSDTEETLRRYGLGKWIEQFRPVTPFTDTLVLTLDIHDGEWDLYGQPSGGVSEEIDYNAEYVVKGDTVDKIHSTGTTTLGWTVNGDTLMLEWLGTNEPPVEGIPDEVFQRALYMTQDFERQS
jgi:hypothetical protein